MKKFLSWILLLTILLASQNLFTIDAHADAIVTDNTVSTYVDMDNSADNIQPEAPTKDEPSTANLGWIWIILSVAVIGIVGVVICIIIEDKKKDISIDGNDPE